MSENELETVARGARGLGADVEIVGLWVWARFTQRPPVDTRKAMIAAGFHWNPKRKLWQFAGVPARHSDASDDELRQKYGALAVA